jgi:MarR family transcriptional regulator, organic hydroperoxide resistance regulator
MKDQQFPPLSVTLPSLVRDGSDSQFRRLIYSLARFSELFVRHRNVYGAYIGLSGPQYVMLTIIAGTENKTVGQIAKAMSVSSQFVASEIGKLIERDIVEKTPNVADRRSMLLSLTAKGRNLFRELGPVRRDSNNLMYRSLTGDRGRILQEILDKLIADGEIALHELEAPHRRSQRAPSVSPDPAARNIATRATRRRS